MKKKMSNEEKVVAALDALDNSVRILKTYGERYKNFIDEAAIRGDDNRAKQLIQQRIRVIQLSESLKTLKGNIELGIYSSQALSELGKLPEAVAGCKGLLAESPNFSKLENSIERIFQDIDKSEKGIAKLNEMLEPKPTSNLESRLTGNTTYEFENTDKFKAEYAAMIERIKPKIIAEKVTTPLETLETTGDIDYAGIIAEENKKE